MTYLCVNCEFLPLYVLNDCSIFKDHQCKQMFMSLSYKFIAIQQIVCNAIPSIGINACSLMNFFRIELLLRNKLYFYLWTDFAKRIVLAEKKETLRLF